jgi:hypothetical protein
MSAGGQELILADMDGEVIDVSHVHIFIVEEKLLLKFAQIPTCHVIGAQDPYLQGSMALFNVCDAEEARLFDHGKGHTLPRDLRTLKELGDVVREMIVSISGE